MPHISRLLLIPIFLCASSYPPAHASIDHTLVRKAGLVLAGLVVTHQGFQIVREKRDSYIAKILTVSSGFALVLAGISLICASHEIIRETDTLLSNS